MYQLDWLISLFNRFNKNRKHHCSSSLTFCEVNQWWLVDSPHEEPEIVSMACRHHASDTKYWYIDAILLIHFASMMTYGHATDYDTWLHQLTEDPAATYSYTCQPHSAMSTWKLQRWTLAMFLWWTLLCLYMINCVYDNCSMMNVDKGVAIKWTW